MNNESELIIGCTDGYLCKFNISNPTAPLLINTIQLKDDVFSFLKLSEDTILCGQWEGYLNIVDVN